jgi:LacI family transcriptional regulator
MTTTIRDVAREAGVSVATVSRVFNNSGPVRPATRDRIDAVAKRLRYAPNSAAQSLSARRSATIGVVLPDLFGEFFSEVIRGIDQAVQQGGFHLLVSSSHNDRAEIEAAVRAMRGRVDGLLVMSPGLDADTLAANLPDRLPVVLLNCEVDDRSFDSLNIDNFGGARAMAEHVLGLGHRRIGVIGGSPRNHDARERLSGTVAAVEAAGLWRSALVEAEGAFTEASGYRGAELLLAESPRPTAIIAANDSMAVGALGAARDAGLRVPAELTVVGFDDIPIARYVTPPLTTVRVDIPRLGQQAAQRLFEQIEAKNGQERVQSVQPTELVVRRSCGAPTEHSGRGPGRA